MIKTSIAPTVIMLVLGFFAYTQNPQVKIEQENGKGLISPHVTYRSPDRLIRDESGLQPLVLPPEIMAVIALEEKKIPLTSKRVK